MRAPIHYEVLFYAITDRTLLGPAEDARRDAMLRLAAGWARSGVDYLQIREKDLPMQHLVQLAGEIVRAVRAESAHTRVLMNVPGDPKWLATVREAGADGVHVGGAVQDIAAVREALEAPFLLSVACHSEEDLERAAEGGADLALLAPIFEKRLTGEARLEGLGLEAIWRGRAAYGSKQSSPKLLALGGVSVENAGLAVAAGADGIAAIRLFLDEGWIALRKPRAAG